ncbi:hypothetical protein [Tessaracoccus sp.]
MTHHLASFRLRAIGDASARFTDLTLDLTSPDGADRIPDDSVVWLRNGGGKSSLLSLFYALLLPREQDFMSRTVKRYLTDYVGTGDTSHTVAVWHPATRSSLLGGPEQVLVTGAVYEWVDQHRPVDAEKSRDRLNMQFYAFYAVPGVLDESNLPFEDENGQPLRLGPFVAALKERAVNNLAALDLVVTDKQYKWAAELGNRGLDPDIFRTQKTMNHVEGGVEDLFKFASAREFIDFLLDLTVAPGAATSVAERLSGIADLLSSKPAKVEERDFCDATAGALDLVARAHDGVLRAQKDLTEAQGHGSEVAASFAATVAAATVDLDLLKPRRGQAEARRTQSSNDAAVASLLTYLYQVRAAELRLADAEEALRLVEQDVVQASSLVDAWKLADHLGARSDLQSDLDQVLLESAAERAALEPQRVEHDRHATRLATRLESLSVDATDQASQEREAARQGKAEAALHEGNAATARANQRSAERERGAAHAKLEELGRDIRRAVHAGHLPSEGADLAIHHEHLLKLVTDLDTDLDAVRERRKARTGVRKTHNGALTDLTAQQTKLDVERSTRADQADKLEHWADTLAGTARVRDLTEATDEAPVNIWGEADTLRGRLTREIIGADGSLIRLEAAQIDSKRVRDAHGRTGFLPTSLDAERVAVTLKKAGIPSESGWSHLRTLLSDDLLAVRLQDSGAARLGCGIVIPTDREEDARRTLSALDTVTVSLVGVYTAKAASDLAGTSHQLERSSAEPAWTGLDRGLVSKAIADSVVNVLAVAERDVTRQQADLVTQRNTDRRLLEQLDAFLAECPAGHLDSLASALETVDKSLADVANRITKTGTTLTELEEAETADGVTEGKLTGQITRGRISVNLVAALTDKASDSAGWKRQHDDAVAAATDAEVLDGVETGKALAQTDAAHAHAGAATTAMRELAGYRAENALVVFLDARTNLGPDDLTVTLDGLRERFSSAKRAWDGHASSSVLAERENSLRSRLGPIAQIISGADPDTLARAGELLVSPSGQSRDGRSDALNGAEQDKIFTNKAEGRAQGTVETATSDLTASRARRADPPRRPLPVDPDSAGAAEALAQDQDKAAIAARATEAEAETELTAITAEEHDLALRARLFQDLSEGLPDPSVTAAAPFTGDDDAARAIKREALSRLSICEQDRTKAGEAITATMTGLRAAAAKYPSVQTKARDRVTHDSPESLAPNAAVLAAQLRLRLDMIIGELEAVTKDQDIVAESLVNLVNDTLDTLRKAERYSRLPDTLGAWANKHMLRINFDAPANDSDLRAQINLVIDRRVATGVKAEGLPLLKDAVHAAVGLRGFSVSVLKPAQDLNATREDITRLGKWSGGEKLTVCVALYCTIAALRAVNIGRRDRSGGVLLLDNPIGRASHGSLVGLQRSVAKAHGVQLVFTTGVKDPDAVSQFPNIVRLDNRAGRTQGRRYVVEGDLDMDGKDDDPVLSLVSGTRISHAEIEAAAAAGEQP